MLKKLTLAAGFGAGYVLGAKAGKERYTQIEAKFREIAGMPAVQNATTTVKETASGLADTAKTTVNDTVSSVADKASDVKASATSSTGSTGSSTPAAGSDPVIDLASAPTGAATTAPTTSTTGTSTAKAPMSGAAASGSTPPVVTRP